MLDVLPEDPVLGVVLKRDEAALLGAAHLQGQSRENHWVSAPISSAPLFPWCPSQGCGMLGLGCDIQGQYVNPKYPLTKNLLQTWPAPKQAASQPREWR